MHGAHHLLQEDREMVSKLRFRIVLVALALAAGIAPAQAAELKLDHSYVDLKSEQYRRFKGWVDTAVSGNPGYAFSAIDAVTMFKLSTNGRYCDTAVGMVQQQVDEANAKIAEGRRPEVAGDSYLEAGPMISGLALTLQACGERIKDEQRTQWSTYAEQAITNIWNPRSARWGAVPAEWTGWSIDNRATNTTTASRATMTGHSPPTARSGLLPCAPKSCHRSRRTTPSCRAAEASKAPDMALRTCGCSRCTAYGRIQRAKTSRMPVRM